MNDRMHYLTPLKTTPFHPRTQAANKLNQWGAWAGYTTATAFDDEAMEYTAIRNSCTVYDLCPMVKYRISGPEALDYLNRLTLRDVAKLPVGMVHYTAWVDDAGKLLDDGTLFRLGTADFRLCCQERHLPWLLDSASGYDVHIKDETADIAALSLQGPTAWSVLRNAGFTAARDLKPFRLASFPFQSGEVMISRTGFTADLGYELWTTPDLALPLWDHLFEAGSLLGLRPIGSNALNLARIEAGFIIANMDFIPAEQVVREDRARSPFELGLEWMIDWTKGHFNGRKALLAERDRGSEWALVALDIDGNVSAEGALIYEGRKHEVGHITAGAWSPATKRNIALAQVKRGKSRSRDLWVEIYALRELQYHKLMVRAQITERPFYSPPRRRQTPPADF